MTSEREQMYVQRFAAARTADERLLLIQMLACEVRCEIMRNLGSVVEAKASLPANHGATGWYGGER